jgi:exodeoxyribonuclease VII small subunit
MSDASDDILSFEQSLANLESIVRDLEDGQLSLEDALGRYERGVALLKRCYTQLRDAEQRILVLTGVDAEGQPLTQPFEHTATANPVQPETRRRRKKIDEPEFPF